MSKKEFNGKSFFLSWGGGTLSLPPQKGLLRKMLDRVKIQIMGQIYVATCFNRANVQKTEFS